MSTPLRIVMMGTGPFAVPCFEALYGSPHQVVALVTQPIRPGPGGKEPPAPMRQVAREHQTPIFDPPQVNDPAFQAQLRQLAPDLLVVTDYGQILRPATLSAARQGGLNLHGSLLPRYRGAAPINWALYHGETTTGVTVIHMTPQVDAGPCLLQASTPIGPDETAPELEHRLAALGAPLILQAIERLVQGRLEPLPQDAALMTRAPRLKKSDGQIDWQRTATQIRNQIRALEPWPKSYTAWHRPDGEPLRLIVGGATVIVAPSAAPPGTILRADDQLHVAAGGQVLQLDRIQPAGKRLLSAAEFLRGYRLQPGQRLGPEAPG